jgi:glycosyltransferase involved in cell wall biosynthesis
MVTTPAREASARPLDGRPLTAVMATRRDPAEYGGVERVVASLLAELARSRPAWQIENISAFPAGSRIEGLDVIADVIAALRLGWRLRANSADIVYVHAPEVLWGIRLLRRRRAAPRLIAVWHGAGPQAYLALRRPGHPLARLLASIRTSLERRALAADRHIAVHPDVAGNIRSLYGFTGHVTVIENGLDPAMSAALSAPLAPKRGSNGINAVWAGQTGYRKGLDVALEAIAQARRDMPGLRLTVVGVEQEKAVDGVDWLGAVPPEAMIDIYREADLLLFPTRYESFGMVVIEAMAAGIPVIVSNAISELVAKDGRNGAVITGHDPADYAAALRRRADPQVRAAIGQTNKEDAQRFSIQSFGTRYAEVAESLAASQ